MPMKEASSHHEIPIRTYPTNQNHPFKPNLNVLLLTRILRATLDARSTKLQGLKRKATEDIEDNYPSKRSRSSNSFQHNRDDDEVLTDLSNVEPTLRVRVDCPRFLNLVVSKNSVGDPIPVIHHSLSLCYVPPDSQTTGLARPDDVTLRMWNKEDKELQHVIASLWNISAENIDLGAIRLGIHNGSAVCVSGERANWHVTENWLLVVPSLAVDMETYDMSSESSADLILSIIVLQQAGRVRLDSKLSMNLSPQDSSPDFPFTLELEIKAFVMFPSISEPFPLKKSSKKEVCILEDARRRLLRAAYLPDPESHGQHKNVTVSTFYSMMEPAPGLTSQKAIDAMQPGMLLPTLLPFQRRSVAWLLNREGLQVTNSGLIIPQTSSSQFSFWNEVKTGERTLYFNRLSGELAEAAPDFPQIYGGMLAEEPGLGKTVETIALIILNPAPSTWNPSLIRWDPVGCLDIKAVKSTLIVTPPALASQWKTELATHAPSLKVLIYEGWTKVNVPITKSARDLERFARLEVNSKPKKKKKPEPKKKSKGKGKRKAKAQDTDSDEISDEDQPGSLSRSDDGEILDWCNYVHQFDVVITTYSVLRSEIHVARPPPDRPRREEAAYALDRTRSPLIMVEWKRVVMDEVQMVGGGQAAEMVSLIPRLSSLAVSGTPAKSHMTDLIHVLKFLRIDQIVGNLRLWNRLLKPGFSEDFANFLRFYGIRTMKSSVTSELTIPQQTRYLVPIDLGKVEQHVYDQTFEAVLNQLGLDARGVAAHEGWQVNGNQLRSAIRRLRGICTHPQVGQLQRKGDGVYKAGALKTIDAVLQAMRDQNWRNLMEDWKSKISALIRLAQLQQKDDSVHNHYQNALKTLEQAEIETTNLIEVIEEVLAQHDAKGKILKEEAARLRQQRKQPDPSDEPNPVDKGKGKATERDIEREEGDEEDPEEMGLPKTPAGEEHRAKRVALKHRLRDGHLLQHRVKFLQGDVFHVLGRSEEEDAAYQAAERVRRDLLKVNEDEAFKATDALRGHHLKQSFTHQDLLIALPYLEQGGIRSLDLVGGQMEEANTIIEEVLNEESDLTWEWRTHIMSLLTKPLSAGEGDADGQEYQRTLDDQGEAETYLQAYAALLADRREALMNERTLLAAHDVREKKVRHTKAAMKAAIAAAEIMDVPEGLEIQPEYEVLHKELSAKRKDILLRLQGRSLRSVLIDLNAAGLKIVQENHPEKIMIKGAVDQLRRLISDQNALHDRLDADLALLRRAFNQRILYFRQLQEISDSVADVEWENSILAASQECVTEKADLDARMNTTRARQRYLDNIAETKDKNAIDEEEKTCVLCRDDFDRGFITHCAHVYCEPCLRAWMLRKDGKTCPVCRVAIDRDTLQRFTVSPNKEPPPRPLCDEPAPQSRREISYNTIDRSIFDDIQTIETLGDFGSKIQTLVRHISYLKLTDPGAKCIVFSAWADSLHIIERALSDNLIGCLRIDQNSKTATEKFASDPHLLVLLLHGERENAGLNVTCASRVFLLESVVHHSFEIQAIARIDRLGQKRPTEVYCYYAEGTIERNILDLAARKGLSLYTKENSSGTVNVSPFTQDGEQEIDNPEKRRALQRGDFIHKVDDMLSILFPHMFEDLEYLLPPTDFSVTEGLHPDEEDIEMADIFQDDQPQARRPRTANAVAGPSRLRLH